MSIISKEIDFDKLSKPWLDPIPIQCKYNELQLEYNDRTTYNNSVKMEKNIHFIWIGSIIKENYFHTVLTCKTINNTYSVYLWIDDNSLNDSIKIN